MSEQLDIFLYLPPASHAGDPSTSFLAEREVTESGARGTQVELVTAAVCRWPGKTSRELAARLDGMDRYDVARRLSDAKYQGRVIQGPKRPCSVSERLAVTWWPKEGNTS